MTDRTAVIASLFLDEGRESDELNSQSLFATVRSTLGPEDKGLDASTRDSDVNGEELPRLIVQNKLKRSAERKK
ncbi:hypothetical protein Ancab_030812 [Ancistrocladus abbreviatus]